jgi:hypothetical protein
LRRRLLEQPHTSAGRIPTDLGYRYYVDNIIDGMRVSRADLKAIEGNRLRGRYDDAAPESPDGKMLHMCFRDLQKRWA